MAMFPPQDDPDATMESKRYDNPIPSRRYILHALEALGEPVSDGELGSAFGFKKNGEQLAALQNRLRAMQRDGQLIQNRRGDYGLVAKMHLIQGKIIGHREGYGFFRPDDGGDDLYLSFRQMRSVFDGDRVLVRADGADRRGRSSAVIVEVLERVTTSLVGRYFHESGVGFVIPDNRRITHQVLIAPEDTNGAETGQFVRVEICVPPSARQQPHGRVLEVLGDLTTEGIETDMALRTFGIPHVWPESVLRVVGQIPERVPEADKLNRVDLRHLPLVTIDGEDARDFDDAVYCESTSTGGFRLLVAIADVSHYVARGDELDDEARLRTTSVYFPNRVVPMLPEPLSNGLCSLNPHVDRLCLVCELRVSAKGKVVRYRFFEGLMCSHARLTYNAVARFLDTSSQGEWDESLSPGLKTEDVRQNVLTLNALFECLNAARKVRGAIDFDTTETQVLYDSGGRIDRIVPRSRNDAHRIIEECMLLANVAAAKLLEKYELPALYRVHEQPGEEKLGLLNQFLASIGLQMPRRKRLLAKEFQNILMAVRERPDFQVIQTIVLRSMMQARYDPEPVGHFGLAYPIYAHFTSPIRRYPDLVVHRAIRYLIRATATECPQVMRVPGAKRLNKRDWLEISKRQLDELGQLCSSNERRADEATRDAMDWLKCDYMQARIGNTYEGTVSSVTPFGLFIELKDIYVEGLVHVSMLDRDYYTHDPIHHRLIGERTQQAHCLADRVRVEVLRVDMDARKIDFQLLENLSDLERIENGIRFKGLSRGPGRSDGGSVQSPKSRRKKKRGTESEQVTAEVTAEATAEVGRRRGPKNRGPKNNAAKNNAAKKRVPKKKGRKRTQK